MPPDWPIITSWPFIIGLPVIVAIMIAIRQTNRRVTYEAELRRELALYHVTLFSVRPPRLLERNPFPFIALDLPATESPMEVPCSIAYRVVTLRTQDGREHQAWARLDFDPSRPLVGLDQLQVDFIPKISELKKNG